MEKRFLILIFVFALFARLIFFDTSYLIWDETVYLMHGKLIAGGNVGYEEIDVRPPLVQSIISLLWKLSPENYVFLIKLILIFLNSLIVFPIYYLGKIYNKKIGFYSAVIISILPLSILHSRYILTDHLGALFGISAFVLFLMEIRGNKEEKNYLFYFGSFFMGLSILTKFTNLLLLLIIIPFWVYLLGHKKIKAVLFSVITLFLTLGPFLLYNYLKYGNPVLTFIKAWQYVAMPQPVDFNFMVFMFTDVFGLIFLFSALLGAIILISEIFSKKTTRFLNGIFIYSFLIILIYFIIILNKGVVKPPTIEWEAERFMLLLIPFIIVFISYFIDYFVNMLFKKNSHRIIFVFLFIMAGILMLSNQYVRAYTPEIEFEDGLRYATKDMALFLRDADIDEFGCLGNCPPIAYYSGKKIRMVFSEEDLLKLDLRYTVSFKELSGLFLVKKFCNKEWCVYLYEKMD